MADKEKENQENQPPRKDGEKEPPKAAAASSADKMIAKIGENIDIFTDQPLQNSLPGALRCFRARGRGMIPENIFAVLCENHLSPRLSLQTNYKKIINPNMIRLIDSHSVYWPAKKSKGRVIIYDGNIGARLVEDDRAGAFGWEQDKLMNAVIKPMVGVLLDMRNKEVVHGCIRPSNLFDGGSKSVDRLVLGDCLSVPAWSNMPTLYLPIERAMASPNARGTGMHEDDLYSFGATLAVLLRGTDPMAGLSSNDIIRMKLEKGSYQALTGRDRFTGPVLELLRGLLIDDPSQRWKVEEIQAWMDGRRLSPKQTLKKIKATRPIEMQNKKFVSPEALASAMAASPTEGVHIIENDDLTQWLRRAVEDKPLRERTEKAMDMSQEGGRTGNYADRLVARVCMALHPGAPIRYKSVSLLPEGIGAALTHAYIKGEDVQVYVDIFMNHFASYWMSLYPHTGIDIGALTQRFEHARKFMMQKGMGTGIERCIYYLDPNAPCLSEKIVNYNVHDAEDLLLAFEELAGTKEQPHYFLDRHIVAFLSVKDPKNIDPYMPEIEAKEPYLRVIGELRTLATIQKRAQIKNVKGVAEWMAGNLDPVYERFHDRDLRKSLKKRIDKLADKGDLTKIAAIFDDANLISSDKNLFYKAIKDYNDLEKEKYTLDQGLHKKKNYGENEGHQGAAILSCILSVIIILSALFMAVSNKFLN